MYSTGGKNVLSLAAGSSIGEIAATSADANGNVYVDEVNMSSTVQNNSYSTSAIHQVSSLGTYQDYQNHSVRAYSSTSVNAPNTLQTANPALVVNDGWISVSATPTGFEVTDLNTHQVLMQVSTPAPVTGIAVDTNLHIAYVTIPDANELLTVPLPN